MAIHLGGKTKLTTEFEKMFIALGGGNPNQTLSQEELSEALIAAINQLPDGSPILRMLHETMLKSGPANRTHNNTSAEGK